MLFSSLTFLYFFLPIVLILYFVINNRTWRNAVLLVSSLVFYSWGEPKYVFLMLASTLVAWLCGLGIDRFKIQRKAADIARVSDSIARPPARQSRSVQISQLLC